MNDVVQRSPEWFAARLGRVTASRVADVSAKTKTGWGTSRANYMAELIVERLTGKAAEGGYNSPAMQWGTDTEPQARAAYEWRNDVSVVEVGFVPHPTIPMVGASPDGLVGADGLIEIKCPYTANHLECLLNERIPPRHIPQMVLQMACTGRQWCDFVSFDPRLPDEMCLYIGRLHRDEAVIRAMEKDIVIFLEELDDKLRELNKRFAPPQNILSAG